ncbi:hypothetical protein COU74_01220 [Candidatus Peregrinibacteria bacterium CG10_big_fil_rev_8_21_14_0_10_36_19]|nr:MAG: hypothetical protein COU74_01220 [Candidatus Peregrinibacteria bacterium CG10_big_fil_rev_8_21_14_0_10_36_19]
MFKLTIRTPYEDVFSGEAESIYLTTEDGDMQIFENHASITASLSFSPVVVEITGKDEHYLARNGLFLFDNEKNEAVLLTLYCELKSEVSYQTVEEYAKFIQEQLEEGKDLSDFQILFLKDEKVAVEEQLNEIKK